jgi:hypothetical protein
MCINFTKKKKKKYYITMYKQKLVWIEKKQCHITKFHKLQSLPLNGDTQINLWFATPKKKTPFELPLHNW